MNKLLRLSNIAINVSHISKICIYNDKYTIHLTNIDFGGLIDTTKSIVEIKKDNHRDYFKISEYILRHSI
jgi:hypothetical protein